MTPEDINLFWKFVDLLSKSDDKISFYWNFYIAMCIAIIGWMIAVGERLKPKARVMGAIGLSFFIFMNISALFNIYTVQEKIVRDINTIVKDTLTDNETTEENDDLKINKLEIIILASEDFVLFSKWVKLAIHVLADIFMFCLILLYGRPKSISKYSGTNIGFS